MQETKKKSVTLLLLFVFVAVVIDSTAQSVQAGYIIDGNRVYIDDDNAFIQAQPHTVASSQWVYINVTSKTYTGDIDVAFGFDTTKTKPTRAELLFPHNETVVTEGQEHFYNVTNIGVSESACDVGVPYASIKRAFDHIEVLVPTYDGETPLYTSKSITACFDRYQNLSEQGIYIIQWDIETTTEEQWLDVSDRFSSVNYEHGGMNKWWFVQDIGIAEDVNYQMRIWLNVPIALGNEGSKYWVAIKPSTQTISEAITAGNFYSLDPWWNSSWGMRRNITIVNPTTEAFIDYPVPIKINNKTGMYANLTDVRFTDTAGNVMAHEYELINATGAIVWVKANLSKGTNIIHMYFNNSKALDYEQPADVWSDNYDLVLHFNNSCKDSANNHQYTQSGYDIGGFDGNEFNLACNVSNFGNCFTSGDFDSCNFTATDPDNFRNYTYMGFHYISNIAGKDEHGSAQDYILYDYGQQTGATRMWKWYASDSHILVWQGGGAIAQNIASYTKNVNRMITAYRNSTELGIYWDDVNKSITTDTTWSLGTTRFVLSGNAAAPPAYAEESQWDEFRISTTARSKQYINMTYLLGAKYNSFVTMGTLEETGGGAVEVIEYNPNVTTPYIAPDTAYTNTALTGNTTYTHQNGYDGNVTFAWYKNNVNIYNVTFHPVGNNTLLESNLSSTNFSAGDRINVSVRGYDNVSNQSELFWSATRTISNKGVEWTDTITDVSLYHTEELVIQLNATDLDGDLLVWSVNDSRLSITQTGNLTDSPALSDVGNWSVVVNVTDVNGSNTTLLMNITYEVNQYYIYIVWDSQVPADLYTLNAIGEFGLNMSYNITTEGAYSSRRLYYKVNGSDSNIMYWQNGTANEGYFSTATFTNGSQKHTWNIDDNQFLIGTYNFGEVTMESLKHNVSTLDNANYYVKVQLLNVSSTKAYGFWEIMANSTTNQILRAYYCNSSYTTGKVTTSPFCAQFGDIVNPTTYNHTHSIYSSHHEIVFAPSAGKIGNVKVTPVSYFLLQGRNGMSVNYYYISNVSRNNAIQTTTNGGTGWTNLVGTVDSHLHQFDANTTLWYYACANITTGESVCSALREDQLDLTSLPPSSPVVYKPIEAQYNREFVNISYTAAISPQGDDIKYYVIDLLDTNFTYNRTLKANNSLNLTYFWNASNGTLIGSWIVRVTAFDNNSRNSSGFSQNFTIVNRAPQFTQTITGITIWHVENFSIQFNATDLDNDSIVWGCNSTLFEINQSGQIADYPNSTDVGIYYFTVNVTDGYDTTTMNILYNIRHYTASGGTVSPAGGGGGFTVDTQITNCSLGEVLYDGKCYDESDINCSFRFSKGTYAPDENVQFIFSCSGFEGTYYIIDWMTQNDTFIDDYTGVMQTLNIVNWTYSRELDGRVLLNINNGRVVVIKEFKIREPLFEEGNIGRVVLIGLGVVALGIVAYTIVGSMRTQKRNLKKRGRSS